MATNNINTVSGHTSISVSKTLHSRVKAAVGVLPSMDMRAAFEEGGELWLRKNAKRIEARQRELTGFGHGKASKS